MLKIKSRMIALVLTVLSGFAFAQMKPPAQLSDTANSQQSQQRFEGVNDQMRQAEIDKQALNATTGQVMTRQDLGAKTLQTSQQTSEQLTNQFGIQNNSNRNQNSQNLQLQQQQFEKQRAQQQMLQRMQVK